MPSFLTTTPRAWLSVLGLVLMGAWASAWAADPPATPLPTPPTTVGGAVPATAGAAPEAIGLAPEISKSDGPKGGVVVLWPRIIPATTDAQVRLYASFLQQSLRIAAERAFPGVPVEVRPEPERVCQRGGCAAVAVGALLTHDRGGCAVVGTISSPGPVEARLFLFSGTLAPLPASVPFREPIERYVTVYDFGRCSDLPAELASRAGEIETHLRALRGP